MLVGVEFAGGFSFFGSASNHVARSAVSASEGSQLWPKQRVDDPPPDNPIG
jgi:hypothetical protein